MAMFLNKVNYSWCWFKKVLYYIYALYVCMLWLYIVLNLQLAIYYYFSYHVLLDIAYQFRYTASIEF